MLTKWLSNILISKDHEQQLVENWFAASKDLADLERRQKMLERGQAPWQTRANVNLRGWV
jgi:hypothetical protein